MLLDISWPRLGLLPGVQCPDCAKAMNAVREGPSLCWPACCVLKVPVPEHCAVPCTCLRATVSSFWHPTCTCLLRCKCRLGGGCY